MSKKELQRFLQDRDRAKEELAIRRQIAGMARTGQVSRSSVLLASEDVPIEDALSSGVDAESAVEMTDENLDLSDDATDAIADSQEETDRIAEDEFDARADDSEEIIVLYQELEAAEKHLEEVRVELDTKLDGLDTDLSDASGRIDAARDRANEAFGKAESADSKAVAADGKATSAQRSADSLTRRGANLITNGYAENGDNRNFTAFGYAPTDAPVGALASFSPISNAAAASVLDEFVTVDPSQPLLASISARQVTAGVSSRFYFGVLPFDSQGLSIFPYHYMEQAGTRTTLAADLKAGDTVLRLTSAAGWNNAGGAANTHFRSMIAWNYVDASGRAWAPGTYSRNWYTNLWNEGGISGNVITLRVPWSGSTIPAGTTVGNGSAGSQYMYTPGISNVLLSNAWTDFVASQPFQGVHSNNTVAATNAWPAGTARARVVILHHYSVTGGTSVQRFAKVSLSPVGAAQQKADQADTKAGNAQTVAQSAQSTADTAKSTADTARQEATSKAAAAEAAAKSHADAQAEAARLAAVATASGDASDKAAAAEAAAKAAAALDASQKADAARQAAEAKAAEAKAAADAAQSRADDAHSLAGTAQSNAQAALTMAGTKSRVFYSTAAPSGTGTATGDLWRQRDSSQNIIAEWYWSGTGWVETKVSSSAISNLDVGKLTVGTGVISDLVANHIAGRTAEFLDLGVERLIVTGGATFREAVAEKIWSDIVKTKFLTVTEKIITQDVIATGAVGAEQIATNALDFKVARGMQMIASLIQAGDGFLISESDGLMQWDPNGRLNVHFPADGSPAQFRGDVSARSLTVPGRMTLEGEGEVSSGASFTISSGVTTPAVPPAVSASYDQLRLPALPDDEAACGLAFAGGHWWRTVDGPGAGNRDRLEKINTSGVVVGSYPITFWARNGLTAVGSEVFILGRHETADGNSRTVRVYNTDGVFQREWAYGTGGGSFRYQPGIGTDGTNIVIAQANSTGALTWRRYNPATGALLSTVITNDPFRADVTGVHIGSADFGVTRVVVAKRTSGRQFTVFSEDGQTYYPDQSWFTPGRDSNVQGVVWANNRFHSLTSGNVVTTYELTGGNRVDGDDTNQWWGAYTWYSTSPVRQTMLGPAVQFVYPRRAKLRFSVPDRPKNAQQARIYLGRGGTPPSRTLWNNVTTTSSNNAVVSPINPIGGSPVPPETNTFPNADPGQLVSANNMFMVDGQGAGKWGQYQFSAAGVVSGPGTSIGGEVSLPSVAANGGMQAVTVTFPAGRFTNPPVISITSNNGRITPTWDFVTATSATLRAWNFFNASAATVNLHWIAMER